MSTGKAFYVYDEGTWFIRLEGEVRHLLGPTLNAFFDRIFRDPGTQHVLVDLSHAESIDSTCLGILARVATGSEKGSLPKPTLVVDDPGIIELLEVVCFDRLFRIVRSAGQLGSAFEAIPALSVEEGEMLALVLNAHRRLCAIDEKTRDVFIDVVKALEQEQKSGADG